MCNRSNTANCESRLCSDQCSVRFAQGFARHRTCFRRIDLISASRQEQNRCSRNVPAKNDRFGDLVQMTPRFDRRFVRCARAATGFDDLSASPASNNAARTRFKLLLMSLSCTNGVPKRIVPRNPLRPNLFRARLAG